MVRPPDKVTSESLLISNMAQTRITTLNGFMQWVEQFDSESYLFRGVPNAAYSIEASAFRRPKEADRDFEKFLQINRSLIRDARLQGYDEKDGRKLKDLEILAEFQHFGAATCLIDFTYNALIALWFACQLDSKVQPDPPKIPDGKVFAVRNEPPGFKEVTLELLEKEIDYFFKSNKDGRLRILQPELKQLYQWRPWQQNHRIIAQQSIFLFGDYHFEADAECLVLEKNREDILTALQHRFGITEEMLFPDFAGFAHLRSEGRPYTEPNASKYREFADRESQKGEYALAITYYDKAINLDPNDAHTHYCRGKAYDLQKHHELAIENYDEAIRLKPENHAGFYYSRAHANFSLKQYSSAIRDYSEVLRILPGDGNCYYHRGLAKYELEQYEAAIADYDEAIRISSNGYAFYSWRGFAKYELEQYEAAIADYDEAIRISPRDRKSYYRRGLAIFKLMDYESAILDFDKAISLILSSEVESDDVYAYYWRARSKRELSYHEGAIYLKNAIADLETALELAFAFEDPQPASEVKAMLDTMNLELRDSPEHE